MRARPAILRRLVAEQIVGGASLRETATLLGLPLGTVKSWVHRARQGDKETRRQGDMKPAMQPGRCGERAKGEGCDMSHRMQPDMQPEEADKSVRVPVSGPAMFRGVTARDMPGRTRVEQSLNFCALKRGTYPPRSWGIPGYLQGRELVEAMDRACEKWRKPKGKGKA